MHVTTQARHATVDDIAELVRLREVMWVSMGLTVGDGWRAPCARVLEDWLRTGTAVAAVVDHPDEPGRLVACGVGSVDQRLPGSTNPTGRYGYIANMVTEPAFRGRGLATSVLAVLLDWFRAEGVRSVDLHATTEGEPLYRAAGFSENRYRALRWRSG